MEGGRGEKNVLCLTKLMVLQETRVQNSVHTFICSHVLHHLQISVCFCHLQ